MLRLALLLSIMAMAVASPMLRSSEGDERRGLQSDELTDITCNMEFYFYMPNYQHDAFGESPLKTIRSKMQRKINSDSSLFEGYEIETSECYHQITGAGAQRRLSETRGGRRLSEYTHDTIHLLILAVGDGSCRTCTDDDEDEDEQGRRLQTQEEYEAASDKWCKKYFNALGNRDPMFNDVQTVVCKGECTGFAKIDGVYVNPNYIQSR